MPRIRSRTTTMTLNSNRIMWPEGHLKTWWVKGQIMGPTTWLKSRHCRPWLSRHRPIRNNAVKIITITIRRYRYLQTAFRNITRRAWSLSPKFRTTTVRIRVEPQGVEENLSLSHLLMQQPRNLQAHLVSQVQQQLVWLKKSSIRLTWRHPWRA